MQRSFHSFALGYYSAVKLELFHGHKIDLILIWFNFPINSQWGGMENCTVLKYIGDFNESAVIVDLIHVL